MKTVNMLDLTPEERKRARTINCGPDCECDTPKTGISIGKMDSFGDPYPDAVDVILDNRTNEWVVYAYDPDAPFRYREAGRHPVADVQAIRYLPNETRLYAHTILDDLDPHDRQAREATEQ